MSDEPTGLDSGSASRDMGLHTPQATQEVTGQGPALEGAR